MTYQWAETSGRLPAGSFRAGSPDLVVATEVSAGWQRHAWAGWRAAACAAKAVAISFQLPPPCAACPWLQALAGLAGGDKLSFTFTATLAGGAAGPASTTSTLELTAQASALQAKIDGPNGDVRVSAAWRARRV